MYWMNNPNRKNEVYRLSLVTDIILNSYTAAELYQCNFWCPKHHKLSEPSVSHVQLSVGKMNGGIFTLGT